jgi:hypothetical protein
MKRAIVVVLVLLLAGCGEGFEGPRQAVDDPLPRLQRSEMATDDDGGNRPVIRIEGGELVELDRSLNLVPAGPVTFFVVNRVEGAGVEQDGLDLSERSVALWLRGRGGQRHLKPEFTIGPVNAGVQEDWQVDLPAGDYLLSVTSGGHGEAILLAR